mmetsp:Transcript_20201/g.47120  ORF Transcript_20201/g.47120 Transcript_20201/m.47120 type:complete len:624 (-) Transcript_20201:34-1905(-)
MTVPGPRSTVIILLCHFSLTLPGESRSLCTQNWQNCSSSHCCVASGFSCYRKDDSYAECRSSCKPGENPKDPQQWRTTWNCSKLQPPNLTQGIANATAASAMTSTAPPELEVITCAGPSGNCLASRCCATAGFSCFEKDITYAQCRAACEPGEDPHEAPRWRTPWTCNRLDATTKPPLTTPPASVTMPSTLACAEAGANCRSVRCCTDPAFSCFEKDLAYAECAKQCPQGRGKSAAGANNASTGTWLNATNASNENVSWTCRMLTQATATNQVGGSDSVVKWDGDNLTLAHDWNCDGQSCDAMTLQPWNAERYVTPPGYAPLDPRDFGGAMYGEKMWLVGSASDALSTALGADSACCGKDPKGVGGCGKCILIEVPSAIQKTWRALVMKKHRCPPDVAMCAGDKLGMTLAVPGFDGSTENVCSSRPGTGFANKSQSQVLSKWQVNCSSTLECLNQCASLPASFVQGCRRFAKWGWTDRHPSKVSYKVVGCPQAFERHIGSLFGGNGSRTTSTSTSSSSTTTQASTTTTARAFTADADGQQGCYVNSCGCPPNFKADFCTATTARLEGFCSEKISHCATCADATWCTSLGTASTAALQQVIVRRHVPRQTEVVVSSAGRIDTVL